MTPRLWFEPISRYHDGLWMLAFLHRDKGYQLRSYTTKERRQVELIKMSQAGKVCYP